MARHTLPAASPFYPCPTHPRSLSPHTPSPPVSRTGPKHPMSGLTLPRTGQCFRPSRVVCVLSSFSGHCTRRRSAMRATSGGQRCVCARTASPVVPDMSADGQRNNSLGQAIPHCARRFLRYWRHRLVPRGWSQRVIQLRRPLGVQAPRQGARFPSLACCRTPEAHPHQFTS